VSVIRQYLRVTKGAVAAPTAGLHFSMPLVKNVSSLKGVNFAEVTLHVGLGTFRPVEVEDLTKHKMDSEQVIITQEACNVVKQSKGREEKNLRSWYNRNARYRNPLFQPRER